MSDDPGLSLLLGKMALKKGYITPEQLRAALADQARECGDGGGARRALGEILVSRGDLTDSKLAALLQDQEVASVDPEGVLSRDSLLGRILIRCEKIPAAHVHECLRLQATAVEIGALPVPRLGELLVQKGYASAEAVGHALALQRKTILACLPCGKRFNITGFDPTRTYSCPSCKAKLDPMTEFEDVRVNDSVGGRVRRAGSSQVPMPVVPPEARPLGKYTILRELGRGGMGVVFEALDTELGRRVALKMLIAASGNDPELARQDHERFLREAHLSASLPKHPHIVSVYEAGTLEGKRYIAMELVEGRSMADWRKGASLTIRQQILMLRHVALAVHHAHEHGVIHRDLKPQNILVDAHGAPHVMDFGLAKPADKDVSVSLTAAGMIVGTPGYMSPEQAQGLRSVDHRTDVYALGVLLYETLAGRMPFEGHTAVDILIKVVKSPVPPPSSAMRRARGGEHDRTIENICLKALAKAPKHRYQTAKVFADDLERWLKGEKVNVRPPQRSRPRWALYGATALAALIAVLLLRLGMSAPPSVEPELAYADRLMREHRYTEAMMAYSRALVRDPENARADAGQKEAFAAAKKEAARKVPEPKTEPRVEPPPPPPGSFRTFSGHASAVMWATLSPDAKQVASAGSDQTVRIWDVATGQALQVLTGHAGMVRFVAWSPDGRLLASGGSDKTVRLWDAATGKPLRTLTGHANLVRSLAFSPDGHLLASGSWDRSIRLWDLANGKPVRELLGHTDFVKGVAFSPDGLRLASGSQEGVVRLWDLATGKSRVFPASTASIESVLFTPDGRTLVGAGHDRTIHVWDAESGRERAGFGGHDGPIESLALGPDGTTLASGGWDTSVRLWDLGTGRPLRTLGSHADKVQSTGFCRTGRCLVTSSQDRTVRVWALK